MDNTNTNVSRFLDKDRKLSVWPSKQADKDLVIQYLSSKFDPNSVYTEREVNDILKTWHTFTDWPLLRRELVDRGYLNRDTNGYEYKLNLTKLV